MISLNRVNVSIALVWLFHTSAVMGCAMGYCDWFTTKTPLNLLLISLLVILDHSPQKPLILLIPFVMGMTAEWIGVHTGWLFGDYAYGNNLGWKCWEVPLLIGMNWLIMIYAGNALTSLTRWSRTLRAMCTALAVTGLDVLMEQVAPQLDFWRFNDGIVPLTNYGGWMIVSFIAAWLYSGNENDTRPTSLGVHIYFAILFYFISINILHY